LLTDIENLLTPTDAKTVGDLGVEPVSESQVPLFLGTVILHEQKVEEIPCFDLVDGQQRSLTLNLLIIALQQYNQNKGSGVDVYNLLNDKEPSLLEATFTHRGAQQQLADNFKQIQDFIEGKTWASNFDKIMLLMQKLEFVVITIHSIDQAFAFFDSQNSSGKRLSDFDLLKARHLRGIVSDPLVGIGCSRIWEEYENLKLHGCYDHRVAYYLTEHLLARARQRQRGKRVEHLLLEQEYPVLTRSRKMAVTDAKADQTAFVQLSPLSNSQLYRNWQVKYHADEKQAFPFSFTTELQLGAGNKLLHNLNDVSQLPLQLNQALIGGEQFFMFIAKYVALYKQIFSTDIVVDIEDLAAEKSQEPEPLAIQQRLLSIHRNLEYRQGRGYPRLIQSWQALVIFYVDRFGEDDNFETFVRLSDQYIFSLRILLYQVKRTSIEKKLREEYVFERLLLLPTSSQAVDLMKGLIDARAGHDDLRHRLNNDVKGVRKSYLKAFYWNEDSEKDNHQDMDNRLSRLLSEHKPNKAKEATDARY
jgi:hypothetical protein